ncbi:hypothetical protein DPMN_172375 [Dreissena polymorpha]|uniref:Uncharacterized protein n=1 Tax=Dreissena polymorpha TaxID=45954 RepID=A0A9D4E306_DREPO|nr:hypothetical protein DPMN_172375 [Dreissena polymorpha]
MESASVSQQRKPMLRFCIGPRSFDNFSGDIFGPKVTRPFCKSQYSLELKGIFTAKIISALVQV